MYAIKHIPSEHDYTIRLHDIRAGLTKKESPKHLNYIIGAAIAVSMLCSINIIKPDTQTYTEQLTPNIKIFESNPTEGEKFLNDHSAMYKMAAWIHDTYGAPHGFSYEIVKLVVEKSVELNQDPFLILAIANIESNFNPSSISNKKSEGLIQVHAKVHGSVKDLPIGSQIEKGLEILLDAKIKTKSDSLTEILQRYNGNQKDKKLVYATKVLNCAEVFKNLVLYDINPVLSDPNSLNNVVITKINNTPQILNTTQIFETTIQPYSI